MLSAFIEWLHQPVIVLFVNHRATTLTALYRTFPQVLIVIYQRAVITVLQAVSGVAKLKVTAGFSGEES